LWQIEQTELAGITFEPIGRALGTIATPENGKLRITVKFDPARAEEIIWHEGAHVYLFHLGYPAGHIEQTADPGILGQPIDFVNEYLANKLEIDRRYRTTDEKVAELRHRLNVALRPLPIRGLHEPQKSAGELAVMAAISATVARQWTSALALEAAEKFTKTLSKISAIYSNVTDAIQQAPSIPFGSGRLTAQTVEAIKSLVSASFNRVYGDSYSIKFTA
jgi:hypothetical protein